MSKRKLIFLDIDGVLNHIGHAVAFQGKKVAYRACSIDSVALGLLKWVCKVTDTEIVISSTWRREGIDWIKGVFEGHGWSLPPIVDRTPSQNGYGGHRGTQIKEWLDGHTYHSGNCTYVIIDDDSDMFDEQKPFFVHTDSNLGFTLYDAINCVELLGVIEEHAEQVEGLKRHTEFQLNKRYRESAKFTVDK